MSRSIIRFGIPMLGGAIVSIAMIACSSDTTGGNKSDVKNDAGSGGSTSTGGKTGSGGSSTGGKTGSGGSTASGGTTSTDSGAGPYTCDAKPKRDPGGTGKEGSACCPIKAGGGVTAGSCVKASSIADKTQRGAYGHDSCAASSDPATDLKCQPTASAMADAGLLGTYEHCISTAGGGTAGDAGGGLEGRCLPKCFVAGQPASDNLKQDGCKTDDMVCAPCWNPIDGTDTGACSQAPGDQPGPKPTPFAGCGALKAGAPNPGVCVPAELVKDPTQVTALENAFKGDAGIVTGCATGQLCAPTSKALDQSSCFTHCTSIAGLEGACVPGYLIPADKRTLLTSVVGIAPCKADETCAPCVDPTAGNAPSGACN
jgi:hypothetical protein